MRDTINFIEKAAARLEKLSQDEIRRIFDIIAKEYDIYALILDNLKEGVIALNNDREIIGLNKQASFLLHIPMSAKGSEILSVVKTERFRTEISNGLESTENIEDIVIEDAEEDRILSMSILPLGKKGVIEGLIILVSDVTENIKREQKLKRAEQLAGLTTLAAGVAHEIKNPLGSIDIYIQLIEKIIKRMPKDTDEVREISEHLSIVKEEISRLEEIINGFLFSVRKLQLDISEVDIARVIQETIDFLKYETEKNDVKVVADLPENLPKIEADGRYLKQAIINIVQNAVESLKDTLTREIHIRAEREKSNNRMRISIHDSGVGIPEENLTKIYEPYFTTKKFGTGLGLTNVFRIIEAHRGEITINSTVGEGTDVLITLPITLSEKKLLEGGR